MSDLENAYKAPANLGELQNPGDSAGGITAKTREFIGKAAPWLSFVGVMGFIGCGFMVLAGLGIAIAGAAMAKAVMPGFSGPLLGLFYIVLAVVCFFPARFTWLMGSAAKAFKLQGAPGDLETVSLNLKKMAKFFGIYIIVAIALVVIVFIGAMIFGLAAASRY